MKREERLAYFRGLRTTRAAALSAAAVASACVFGEPECKGCKARPKVRCAKLGVVIAAASCTQCVTNKLPLSELHIGAVITAWNEGDEVRATIASLLASVKEARLTVILVDDGSTDASCSPSTWNLEPRTRNAVIVIRHDQPQGIGRSRNAGWARAQELGCHIVTFHDAHMRFDPPHAPERVLERLSVKAMANRAVISSGSRDIPGQGPLSGCWMHYDPRYGIQPKWDAHGQDAPVGWRRTPCMMGAGYVMSAETAAALEAPTGQLWEDTAGRWGFSEQALSIKAYLLDIPVLTNHELIIAHKYKAKNPTPNAGRDAWKNAARSVAVLFGSQVYEERFATWCEASVPKAELAPILAEAFESHPALHSPQGDGGWPVDPATVWTHLLGEGAPITEPHPDHAWLAQVAAACRELAKLKGTPRVFVWRPGEAMLLVRQYLPSAEITVMEVPGHRFATWLPICKSLGIKLIAGELAPRARRHPYAVPPKRECDLILVNGEMQEACTAAAKLSLKPGGTLLVNPSADRRQLESGERDTEAKNIAAVAAPATALAGPTTGLPPVIPPAGAAAPSVSVVLLNWKRPENLIPILASIAAQSVRAQVMIWNNGAPLPDAVARHPLVVSVVNSTGPSGAASNLGCMPRWWLASRARTEWICTLDDDLCFGSPDALAAALDVARRNPDCLVGAFGVQFLEGKSYRDSAHVRSAEWGAWVDVVKNRFTLCRRALLERLPMHLSALDFAGGLDEDIALSLCLARGKPRAHLVASELRGKFKELPAGNVGVEAQPGHWERRQKSVEAILAWHKGGVA